MSDKPKLTLTNGAPVGDNQNVLTAGPRGPMLLRDLWFVEKLAHFDREVIPEHRLQKGRGNTWKEPPCSSASGERPDMAQASTCRRRIASI